MPSRSPLRLLALLAALPLFAAAPATPPATAPLGPAGAVETKDQKDARMHWWREARFGMFIHWGLYAVPAGVYKGQNILNLGEWIQNNASIPVAEYATYADAFNPTRFNAEEYVALAKNAGMKYIIITSKHHDGFALFKTAASPFNIVDGSPFKRDVIKELETAARTAGLRFGVYYSQSQDWHHPGGYAHSNQNPPRRPEGTHWDPAAQDGSFDEYLQKIALPQTRELLTNYKLDVLWWDTPGPMTREQAAPFHALLKLQPAIITNNRLQNTRIPGPYSGDTETPEQFIPATGFPGGRDWETCMTMNNTWGYKSTDTNYKSSQTLIRNLIDIASKGGNYLLNVGPTAQGNIPDPQIERLRDIGKWLAANGEAIYATGPNPFPPAPRPTDTSSASAPATAPAGRRGRGPQVVWDWRATTKPGKIFLHIFQWPANGAFTVPAIPGNAKITKAYLLTDPQHTPLQVTPAEGKHTLALPPTAPDPIATVICLDITTP